MLDGYDKVQVALADGQTTWLAISLGGAMVTEADDIEPILPMGLLTEVLNCSIKWEKGQLEDHPRMGRLPVQDRDGCPQIPRKLALELIEEMEKVKLGMKFEAKDGFHEEVQWMLQLIEAHPVLSRLPQPVKEQLVVQPGPWRGLPVNRRTRKKMKKTGFVLHLYAGPGDGFTLGRAWQQLGGASEALLEIDALRGPEHNMLGDSAVYAALITCALEDRIKGIVGGPNCRTRSILRHRPGDGENPPRPVRRWGGEEFGIEDATEEEKEKLKVDDILMWRMLFLGMLINYLRQARGINEDLPFSVEQPASPKDYNPEVVSFWNTSEWEDLKREFGWFETTFNQRPLGGAATKPTTFGGSLLLRPEDHQLKSLSNAQVKHSWQLARWPPGLMNMVAEALLKQAMHQGPRLKYLSWEEHLAFGHTPARRDCRTCQECRQQANPHRKVTHPLAGVLSLDTAGPLKPTYDAGGHVTRYFLAASFTWCVPKGAREEGRVEAEEDQDDYPVIEAGQEEPEENEDGEEKEGRVCYGISDAEEAEGRGFDELESLNPGGEDDEEKSEEGSSKEDTNQGEPRSEDDMEIRVFRLALPMLSKKAAEVTKTTMEFILRLRMDGYHVNHIHADQGHELAMSPLGVEEGASISQRLQVTNRNQTAEPRPQSKWSKL